MARKKVKAKKNLRSLEPRIAKRRSAPSSAGGLKVQSAVQLQNIVQSAGYKAVLETLNKTQTVRVRDFSKGGRSKVHVIKTVKELKKFAQGAVPQSEFRSYSIKKREI